MSLRRACRPPAVIVASAALALLFSGCIGIKAGTYVLSQPAGIGAVTLKLTVCTQTEGESPPEGELPIVVCGPPKETGQGQMLVSLMVPVGSSAPETFNATPGPGAGAIAFTRNPELTAKMNATELTKGSVGPPPGVELGGYSSGPVAESSTQEFTWTIETSVGLPAGAGGGSYGGPLKATVIVGWRRVNPEAPISRPINCEEGVPGETFCGTAQPNGEATLGVSDLKIAPPASATVVPGAKVTLPFVLDFASSAAELPKFKLAATSNLPEVELSLSSTAFTRGPTEAGTNRAPATTRKAIVQVPAGARLGSYELALTATANQGGAAGAATTLVVKPKGTAKLTVPKRVKATIASGRGIPVQLVAPIAGTRFPVVLKGPGPGGKGKVRLSRKVRVAGELGPIELRLRIPRAKAEEFLAAGATLRLQARVTQPGARKPKLLLGALKLR